MKTSLRKLLSNDSSCLESVLEVDESDPEDEFRQAWNHERNEVLRIALYPNTVFNEMWFLTVDPLIWVCVHRKAVQAMNLLAYPRGLSLSIMYPILWHKL